MAGWSPKRNLRVAELSLPLNVEVALTASTFKSIAGVQSKTRIKAIEVHLREKESIRFGTVSGSTVNGPYRTIRANTTMFHEDLSMNVDQFDDEPWRFQNPSGTGTSTLEIIFSDG